MADHWHCAMLGLGAEGQPVVVCEKERLSVLLVQQEELIDELRAENERLRLKLSRRIVRRT